MKNIVINYKVFNNKINNKGILVLSDMHNCTRRNCSYLIDSIKSINPDYVFITGDTLSAQKYIEGSINQKRLKDFLKEISENSTIFLGLGNHDLCGSNDKTILGYKNLEKAREGKVFPLCNESIVLDDMRITEFHPSIGDFIPSIYESGNGVLRFADDFEKSNINIPKDELYNVLIYHDPKSFAQARSVGEQLNFSLSLDQEEKLMKLSKKMSLFDMVVCGHMHNGYISTSKIIKNPSKYIDKGYTECPLEKDVNGDITHIRPWFFKETDMCRGTIFIGESNIRVIQLCDGSYYYKNNTSKEYVEVTEEKALKIIEYHRLTPIIINGGINKYFSLPIDKPEITHVKILKK